MTNNYKKKQIGAAFARLRKERFLKQNQVVDDLEWSYSALSDFEQGRAVTVERLIVLLDFYKLTLEKFKETCL